jgi:hypothetical protein
LTVSPFFLFSQHDVRFMMLADFFVFREMPALHCVRAGVREDIPRCYTAGRKVLLPVLYARGAVNYGPATLAEIATIEHRCPPEVRAKVELFNASPGSNGYGEPGGQGFDWTQEGDHKPVKQAASANTARGWTNAAALQVWLDSTKPLILRHPDFPNLKYQ